LLSSITELRFGASAFWHTVFVFGVVFRHAVFLFDVVLDWVLVEHDGSTPFWDPCIWAYRFRVWRSVGSGGCWAELESGLVFSVA
jgi:hypothetical protein